MIIILIATAAVLSCSEGQAIVNNIDVTKHSTVEVTEIVESISAVTPEQCKLEHPNETT